MLSERLKEIRREIIVYKQFGILLRLGGIGYITLIINCFIIQEFVLKSSFREHK